LAATSLTAKKSRQRARWRSSSEPRPLPSSQCCQPDCSSSLMAILSVSGFLGLKAHLSTTQHMERHQPDNESAAVAHSIDGGEMDDTDEYFFYCRQLHELGIPPFPYACNVLHRTMLLVSIPFFFSPAPDFRIVHSYRIPNNSLGEPTLFSSVSFSPTVCPSSSMVRTALASEHRE